MSYLEEFRQRIERDDYPGFLQLWEEYCAGDEVEPKELKGILDAIEGSRFDSRFGAFVEAVLPLWEKIDDAEMSYEIFKQICDLQTTNSPEIKQLIYHLLEDRYGDHELFDEKIRLVGLRNHDDFQGAIRNFDLLTHLVKGNFVYHTGGWGAGEVMGVSLVREEVTLEFEAVAGMKTMTFQNAFGNLEPIPEDHFLARRFGDPDALEEVARRDPVGVVRMLLRDLGPKTAAEIKEEMVDLVIPSEDWTRWWQSARSRLKRDTRVETPGSVREPFILREEELSHAARCRQALQEEKDPEKILLTTYNFGRDFPEVLREGESRDLIRARILELIAHEELTDAQKLQATALIEEFFGEKPDKPLVQLVQEIDNLTEAVDAMSVAAFKKVVLAAIRKSRKDWDHLFLEMLFKLEQSALREYLVKELSAVTEARQKLIGRIEELIEVPIRAAHLFVWCFQKVMTGAVEMPLSGKDEAFRWLESFLILMHQSEHITEYRDLVKKMYHMLTAKRYQLVRELLKESSIDFAREFLLLVSKCHTLNDHDQTIMRSLAEVVHPQLAKPKEVVEEVVIWTTEEGYRRLAGRIEEIGTVETVDNAKEIESARELGDLRENAEYKAALERRARLQAELRTLSDQLNRARILTPADVVSDEVSTGTVVEIEGDGTATTYTILGPWDADPEAKILSYQSKLAQAMIGLKEGQKFSYQGKEYTIQSINGVFDVGATA